ncbi:MAG: (d)CMP kinase [Nitrococcus mobilis]|nr:(d)CMP kinase [Nitrococcus mobilis]
MCNAEVPVLTLDGPSGAGKGTVARLVSESLHWHLLDSGAIYRVLALSAERAGVAMDDVTALLGIARTMVVDFRLDERGKLQVLLDGDDLTKAIRSETCGKRASQVAALPAVRGALLQCQRAFRRPPGLVADGRDMGTVVFPDALVKIYLTASVEERARRRYKQLMEQGISGTIRPILREIEARDVRDCTRSVSPLVPAPDAVILDTTGKSVEAVVNMVLSQIRRCSGYTL